jgi:hypothetical protein
MQRKPEKQLKLGDRLDGTVIKPLGGRRFLLKSNAAPQGWKVELHARKPELIEEGSHVNVWVAKIAPMQGELLVHDGDFGRLPVSAAMRPRYLEGLRAFLGDAEPTVDNLAEARGMLVRISKRQQADWVSVWRLLGEPNSGDVKLMLSYVDDLRTARKEDPDRVPSLIQELGEKFGDRLREAVLRLERQTEEPG